MKIYGVGILTAPGSSRVAWDFTDGPFDTVNPVLIAEAKKRGYSFSPPQADKTEPTIKPKDTPKKRGRPRSRNVNA